MAFTRVNNTTVRGTGTIEELVTTLNRTASAQKLARRSVWLREGITLTNNGSVLEIPSGWHVDVDQFLRAGNGCIIRMGTEDALSPDEGASIYFNNATPASNWTSGSMDATGNGRWEIFNSVCTWAANGNNNRPLTCGFDEPNTSYKVRNSVWNCEGPNGSFYLGNLDIEDSYLIGSRGGEFINSPPNFKNVIIKDSGTQGYKIYPANVTVDGVQALADSNIVFSIGNGKTYTLIDCVFGDNQFRMTTDGANQNLNTAIIQFSLNGRYSIGGIAQSGIQYALLKNDNSVVDSGSIDADGNISKMVSTAYFHNNSSHGNNFSLRTGVWSAPWVYRARGYNTFWAKNDLFPTAPTDISTGLSNDVFVTQTAAVAQSHAGISIVDHGANPVTWKGLKFGITVAVDKTVNPGATVEDVKHWLKYHLSQNAPIGGKGSGLEWHDLIPMSGINTARGSVFGPRLSATVNATATTISLESTASLPSSGFISIGDEQISYTGKTGGSITGCVRGHNSTTAQTHTFNNAAPIYARLLKGVRVIDETGEEFNGIGAHFSDSGESFSVITLELEPSETGSDVRIFQVSDNTELAGTNNSSPSLIYTYSEADAGQLVNLVVQNINKKYIFRKNFPLPSKDTTISFEQADQPNYKNPI